ncbi:hypothetical protein Tco_1508371 [Tanacetum coccineum]
MVMMAEKALTLRPIERKLLLIRMAAATAESRKDRSLHTSPHDSANYSIHRYADGHDDNEETNSLRLGSLVDQSGGNLNIVHTEVLQSSSSNHSAHPSPTAERRTSPVRSPLQGTQEESNALNNANALERSWFSLARGALAQTNILEREALRQSLRLYLEMAERFKKVKNDHASCTKKIQLLEDQNIELSQANKDQALRIRELEDTLVKKDSALVYAKRINAERAQEKEKLVAQLTKTEMENFDCIRKLLPTAGWAKRLAEERFEEDLLELMSNMEDFDVYADKRMYVEYDKLFEK